MNCEKCYHYQACASIDVTGYVNGIEKDHQDVCEYFLNPKDVKPTSHWEREVFKYPYSKNVRVSYVCHRCRSMAERVYTHDFFLIDLWNDYQADHWMPGNDLPHFCSGCGSEMKLDKTDHTNRVTIG